MVFASPSGCLINSIMHLIKVQHCTLHCQEQIDLSAAIAFPVGGKTKQLYKMLCCVIISLSVSQSMHFSPEGHLSFRIQILSLAQGVGFLFLLNFFPKFVSSLQNVFAKQGLLCWKQTSGTHSILFSHGAWQWWLLCQQPEIRRGSGRANQVAGASHRSSHQLAIYIHLTGSVFFSGYISSLVKFHFTKCQSQTSLAFPSLRISLLGLKNKHKSSKSQQFFPNLPLLLVSSICFNSLFGGKREPHPKSCHLTLTYTPWHTLCLYAWGLMHTNAQWCISFINELIIEIGEIAQWPGPLFIWSIWFWFWASAYCVTTFCNPSYRVSNSLFWSL